VQLIAGMHPAQPRSPPIAPALHTNTTAFVQILCARQLRYSLILSSNIPAAPVPQYIWELHGGSPRLKVKVPAQLLCIPPSAHSSPFFPTSWSLDQRGDPAAKTSPSLFLATEMGNREREPGQEARCSRNAADVRPQPHRQVPPIAES